MYNSYILKNILAKHKQSIFINNSIKINKSINKIKTLKYIIKI
jgi:hypothetical protein